MTTTTDLIFLIGLTLLLVHELDAIQQHEWRFFFAFTRLGDETACRLFTALHLPLFVFMLWNLSLPAFQIGFDLFLIIHAGVHWLLRNHPKITFNHWFSRQWIFGGAVMGIAHLALANA